MSVVKERQIGNTIVRIYDDCCRDTSPETVDETLRRITVTVQSELTARAEHPAV